MSGPTANVMVTDVEPTDAHNQQKLKKTENPNLHGFEVHRPSSKGTKLLLQVIKAIINQGGRLVKQLYHTLLLLFNNHTSNSCTGFMPSFIWGGAISLMVKPYV